MDPLAQTGVNLVRLHGSELSETLGERLWQQAQARRQQEAVLSPSSSFSLLGELEHIASSLRPQFPHLSNRKNDNTNLVGYYEDYVS